MTAQEFIQKWGPGTNIDTARQRTEILQGGVIIPANTSDQKQAARQAQQAQAASELIAANRSTATIQQT